MPRSQSQLGLFAALGPTSSNQLLLGTSSWTGDGWVGSKRSANPFLRSAVLHPHPCFAVPFTPACAQHRASRGRELRPVMTRGFELKSRGPTEQVRATLDC